MQIELNDEEARVLVEFLNVAVKSAGLDAAEAALHFRRKIMDAAAAAKVQAEPEPPVDAG